MRFLLPLLALATVAVPAAAQETVTVRIGYGDVDVTTSEGRAVLEARIEARLKKACALEGAARYTHSGKAIDSKCLTEARAAAKTELERIALREGRGAASLAAN
ncbi:UrcA family protein [Erythrobacter sp. NE805]|uniref:UrcA family protein n=1 Tax=Erythrobacter sp. NE805 TaxID=3389875 RepID=UPI00396B0CFA